MAAYFLRVEEEDNNMKKLLILCLMGLMGMVLTGVALAGSEGDGKYNVYYGLNAGNTGGGQSNSSFGYQAGYSLTTGDENTFVGFYAGKWNETGKYNNFIGNAAGFNNTTGSHNNFIGRNAGAQNSTGNYNTYIGNNAGQISIGSSNVFIGNNAGSNQYDVSNRLYIANSETSTPLIYGEFDNNILSTPGYLGIGTKIPVRQLHLVGRNAAFRMDRDVDGASFFMVRTTSTGDVMKTFQVGTTASAVGTGEFIINDLGTEVSGYGVNRMKIANNGSVTFTGNVYANSFTPSSMTYKNNVRTYENALETVNKLRGVRFDWKDSGKPAVGLIAEEVEQVVPEVVAHNDGNVTGVNYASLVGVLVEAVKEQQKIVREQENAIKALQDKNSGLEQLEQRILMLEGK